MGPNALGPIMQLLPLMLILPMLTSGFGGSKKAKALVHSPGRSAAKYVMGALGIAGGTAAAVVAPILIGVLTPPKITAPADVDSAAKVADYLNAARKANFAAGLTAAIGGGAGGIASGIGAMLAKA